MSFRIKALPFGEGWVGLPTINEELNAGEYEIKFRPESPIGAGSIKQPASGIYFYKLIAGSFIETKKMVLLK